MKISSLVCIFAAAGCARIADTHRSHVDPEHGFSFTYPATWQLTGREDAERRERLARGAAKNRAEMAEAQKRHRELVSVKIAGPAGDVAGRMTVHAIEGAPAEVLAGYLVTMKEGLKDASPDAIEQESGSVLNGRAFERMRFSIKVQDRTVHQELFVTAAGKASLSFAITAGDLELMRKLREVVATIAFEAPAR